MATEGSHGAPGAAPKTEAYRYSASSYTTKSNEEELFELVELSGVPLDKELFKVILELLKLNIPPTAIFQIIKTIKSKVMMDPSSTQSSRQQSPVHSVPASQLSNTALHRVKPDQGSITKDQQKSTHHHGTEHKTGRSRSARSAEKPTERTTKASSGKHRSSLLKHKTPGSSSKTQPLSRT